MSSACFNNYTLANDLDRQFGDLPVGERKMMLLFLNTIHGFAGNPRGQFTSVEARPGMRSSL